MKTSHSIFTIAALAGALTLTAFAIPYAPTQTTGFTDKYWMLESSTVVPAIDLDMDGKPDSDIRVMMEDCDKDDAEMFKSGGKLIRHNGRNKCDEEDEDVMESGTWKYNAATKQLTSHHFDTEKPQTVIVKEVTANKLVLTYEFSSNKGKHQITAFFKVK